MGISLVNVRNVPLVEVGMEYPAMTGPVTFTFEQVADAVLAYQKDDAIVAPRLKLGHISGVFKSSDMPALGVVENMALSDNGKTIMGDYVGVPEWLAEILPFAYPSRSVEANFDVVTTTGKKWKLVITDLALLGVCWPGCMTIDDLPLLYDEKIPDQVELSEEITAMMSGGELEIAAGRPSLHIKSQVHVNDVERAFYNDFAQDERYWWYIVADLLDPIELIAEDDTGGLQRVPVTIKGKDITFGDPVPVNIEFVNAESRVVNVVERYGGRVAAAYKTREASGAHASNREGGAVVDAATLRKTLNLPDDTPDAEVLKVANERLAESPEPTPGTEPGTEPETPATSPGETPDVEPEATPEDTPPGDAEPEATAPEQIAASVVSIDRGTLAQLQKDAQLGRKAHDKQEADEDSKILTEAMEKGKFPPARLEHWTALMKADREGTIATLETLAENVIPIDQRARQESTESGSAGGYPQEWLPEVEAMKAQAATGKRPQVQMEA